MSPNATSNPSANTSSQTEKQSHAVATSSGIRAIANLPSFLGVTSVVSPSVADTQKLNIIMVVVWGRKESAAPGLKYAAKKNLPVVFIEDGWVRTCSADSHSRRVYSLLVDHQGVYYDSTAPSELENLLNLPAAEFSTYFDSDSQAETRRCRKLLVDNCITKYNFCAHADKADVHRDDRDLIIVIDQTLDDASVRLGSMNLEKFNDMLTAAVTENPNSRIVVRTHPDVVSGRKSGYLSQIAESQGLEISAKGDNPMDWLKAATKVYVGTSQIGYEALLCGAEVHVFGKPFYAGWGLTKDRQSQPRRIQKRSLNELFFVAHILLARYCHPVTGEPWKLYDCLQHVCLQQHEFARNRYAFVADGITLWKRRYLRQFLRSPEGSLRFSQLGSMSGSIESHESALTWSFRDQIKGEGVAIENIHRIEDGFLRSQGLGSDFVAPASIVVDSCGLYFDPSAPSDLENLLQEYDCSEEDICRAAQLRSQVLAAGVSKYNVGGNIQALQTSADQPWLLVVGQVADDESIKRGSVNVSDNLSLCQSVRMDNPDAYIVFKPHPDVVSGNRHGAVADETLKRVVDEVITDVSIIDCIERCDEVHTITSLSGFEALLRGKHVVTYGLPFYAGWGLTQDRCNISRRTRLRTLDELVFCSLIAYPKYLDIDSGEFISPEDLIRLITRDTLKPVAKGSEDRLTPQLWRKAQNIVKALRYRAA